MVDRTWVTEAGKRFLEESRKVVAAADRAVNIAQRTARGEIGSLTIGFLIWGTGAFFPGIIRDFRKLHPDVQLSFDGDALACAAGGIAQRFD
jgi:DNA-binding transcriptional LysR family regulator